MEEDTIRTLEYLEQDERTKSFFHSSPPQEQIRAQLIEKFNELARSLKQSLTNLVWLPHIIMSITEPCISRKMFR